MAILIRLDMAREQVDSEDLAKQLDAIQTDALGALEELRALAHGIYPAVLQRPRASRCAARARDAALQSRLR